MDRLGLAPGVLASDPPAHGHIGGGRLSAGPGAVCRFYHGPDVPYHRTHHYGKKGKGARGVDDGADGFFDTAGIRETEDQIESMGIERSYSKLEQATVVLLVVDTHNPFPLVESRIQKIRERIAPHQTLIIVANKIDTGLRDTIQQIEVMELTDNEKAVFIAAKQKENLDELIDYMTHSINMEEAEQQDVIVTNARHYEILKNAHEAILRVLNGLDIQITGDFLAQDIRECLHYLAEITGEVGTEEVLGHIFKNFCIGK